MEEGGVERVPCTLLFFQLSQCVMTHNMANYLQIEEDSDAKGTCMYMYVHTFYS